MQVIRGRSLALEMVKLGYRTSIIEAHTQVPATILRKIHKNVFNESAPSGPMRQTDSIILSRLRRRDASLFLSIYENVGGIGVHNALNLCALNKSHNMYISFYREYGVHNDPIDINEAWQLARDLRSGIILTTNCVCGFRYITTMTQKSRPSCPVCRAIGGQAEQLKSSGKSDALPVPGVHRARREGARPRRASP